jgi:hypothetical protein
MLTRFRKIRADRRRWAAAQSFAELSELMALFLEGELSVWPGYRPGGLDEETADLIPVLAAVNRAGFVTTDSQPGGVEVVDGVRWVQRAAVTGLVADEGLLSRIRQACEAAGLLVMLFRPPRDRRSQDIPATFRDGVAVSSFGRELSLLELESDWRRLGPAALAEVTSAWQVTIIDLEDGRNDWLWPALAEALKPVEQVSS